MASGKDCREKNTEIFASKGQEQIFLFCSVDANFIKNSQIRWRRNNQEITLSPPYSIAWERGKLLMIRPVIVGITDGYYECVANLGSVELQKSVKITVKNELPNGFPQIKTHPVNIRQPERKIIDFNCVVSGKKPLQVIWFHNRVPITSTNNYYVHTYKSLESSDLFISNLSLRNVSNSHTGFYQCVAFNEYGQDASHQAMFSVAPKRFHRETSLDDGWLSENCSNVHESNGVFKGIRICCSRNQEFYFNLQWTNPLFGSESVNNLIVGVNFNGVFYCSLQKNNTTNLDLPVKKPDQTIKKLDGFIKTAKASTSFSINFDQCVKEKVGVCYANTLPNAKLPEEYQSYRALYIIFVFVLSLIIVISSVWIVLRVRRNRFYGKMSKVSNYDIKDRVVYISHCASTEKEKEKVLSLAVQLHSISNVRVCIDLCNQNPIVDCGGLPIWVPENLSKADKIVMIFSPLYLEAIKSQLSTEEIFCKVNTEADLIKKSLYYNCQRSSQFAVVLDGVKKEEIPPEFYGRAHFTFPNDFNVSDKNWNSLLSYLLDISSNDLPLGRHFK